MGDTSIDKLFEGDDNSRLLARVSRLWEFTDCKDATKIYHIDLVLVDEKVFKPLLTEGKVYYLDSYRVKTSNKSYRPVANPLMMTFTKWTSVEQCLDVPFNFPTVVYTLTPLNEVSNFVDKNESFVDVIGFITEISTPTMLRPKSRDASSLKRIIQICDANNSTLNVSLWAEQALAFDAESIHKAGQSEPQIVLFVGTLAKNYPGIGLALSRGSACKWYININVPEMVDLKNRIGANFQPIKLLQAPTTNIADENADDKTVRELLDMNPHKNRRTRFQANVTIRKICNDSSWWYNSCEKCLRVVKPFGYTYKCTGCYNIAMAVPRYKLSVLAGDDTADAVFILFGKIAQRIVRKPVELLVEQTPRESKFILDAITALLEISFTWNVSFTENTLRTGDVSFQVNSVISMSVLGEPLMLMSPGPADSPGSSAIMSPGPSTSIMSPTRTSEIAISSPPLATIASPVTRRAAPQTPTSILSLATTEQASHVDPLSPPMTQAVASESTEMKQKAIIISDDITLPLAASIPNSSTKKRTRPLQASPTAKKLFTDDGAQEKEPVRYRLIICSSG
uniref:DNA binding protein-like n=1 Tax=Oryza sativa subsp. japonica TaxID=39947 RepID=Q8GSD3_ORYSJ|nr:DNA binding protein-like [Oryza sativa Japonica Group]BAC22296.1 DNA binding protein-like [Oryza sativa Japonica Group]